MALKAKVRGVAETDSQRPSPTATLSEHVSRVLVAGVALSLAAGCSEWDKYWEDDSSPTGPGPPADTSPPIVTLATPDGAGGRMNGAGVYLCLGTEPRRQHYAVLSRCRERALILYQEASPLAGESAEGSG